MNPRTLALIANLSSHNHQDQSQFDRYVMDTLEGSHVQIVASYTSNLEELELAVKEAIKAGIKEFIAIGGDGTLHHLVNQLALYAKDLSQIKLAVLPKGTGNDYIRNFHFLSIRDILQAIIAKNYLQVDLGCLHYSDSHLYFINMLGLGFSAAVVQNLDRYKWVGGFSYYLALIDSFFCYQSQEVSVEIDGETHHFDCFQLSVGLGKYAGNNMKLCPDALINDGLFDIHIIERVSWWKLLLYLHTLRDGSYLKRIRSQSFKATSIKFIRTGTLSCEADGEELACPKEILIRAQCVGMINSV